MLGEAEEPALERSIEEDDLLIRSTKDQDFKDGMI